MPDEREYIDPEHRAVLEEHGWDIGPTHERAQGEPHISITQNGRVLFGTPSELAGRVRRETEQEQRRQRAGMTRAIDSFFAALQELYDGHGAEKTAVARRKELTASDELTPSGHEPLTAHQDVDVRDRTLYAGAASRHCDVQASRSAREGRAAHRRAHGALPRLPGSGVSGRNWYAPDAVARKQHRQDRRQSDAKSTRATCPLRASSLNHSPVSRSTSGPEGETSARACSDSHPAPGSGGRLVCEPASRGCSRPGGGDNEFAHRSGGGARRNRHRRPHHPLNRAATEPSCPSRTSGRSSGRPTSARGGDPRPSTHVFDRH